METLKISTKPTMSHIQNQIHPLNLKPYPLIHNSRILGVYNNKGGRTFSFTLTCKLKVKTVKGTKTNNEKSVSGQITVPDSDSAPPIIEAEEGSIGNGEKKMEQKNSVSGSGLFKKLPRKVLGILSNLPLAIAEMFAVAGLMALGTISAET